MFVYKYIHIYVHVNDFHPVTIDAVDFTIGAIGEARCIQLGKDKNIIIKKYFLNIQ